MPAKHGRQNTRWSCRRDSFLMEVRPRQFSPEAVEHIEGGGAYRYRTWRRFRSHNQRRDERRTNYDVETNATSVNANDGWGPWFSFHIGSSLPGTWQGMFSNGRCSSSPDETKDLIVPLLRTAGRLLVRARRGRFLSASVLLLVGFVTCLVGQNDEKVNK